MARYELDGRTAVITGAASGIGRALAQHLAGRCCPVAICDQDEAGTRRSRRWSRWSCAAVGR